MVALGLGPGDEVIVPTLTYIASVNAIVYTGATPVFVDSVAETWQISADDVRAKITPRTRAIMAVHLYGHPCDMPALRALADEHGLFWLKTALGLLAAISGSATWAALATFQPTVFWQ